MKKIIALSAGAALVAMFLILPAVYAKSGKGFLYHDGEIVRTVVPPSSLPHGGTDPFFSVTNGVAEQLGIAGLAPGERGYSGGDWAMNQVTFNDGVAPYLLTSDEAVAMAEAVGDVTVVRLPELDFRCPVQP